jgi:hypothetical protein
MNMNRRQALGVIGLFAASPMMLVKPQEKKIIRTDQEIIPTGFPVLDEALRGGLRPGINAVIGPAASGKSVMVRSIALCAARTHSVAMLSTQDDFRYTNQTFRPVIPYEGKLHIYPPENHLPDLDWWKQIAGKYDLIIDEQFEDRMTLGTEKYPGFKARKVNDWMRLMSPLAYEQHCCIVIVMRTTRKVNAFGETHAAAGYPRHTSMSYFASTILAMHRQDTACQWTFDARLTKNRYGEHVKQNLVLDVGKHVFVPAPFNWGPMPRQHYQIDQLRDKPDPFAVLKSLG